MGFFSSKKEGGLMDVIRCDEQEYLVWKWRPSGEANSTKKENSIRYGSSLRVKSGEVAVFVYSQPGGEMQDFIVGPHDKKIESANFPVLTQLVGLAWGGNTPFQAEIYFINISNVIQIRFGLPYFDVYDPRFLDFGVPVAVRGTITFNIEDYEEFVKHYRLINFEIEDLKSKIKDAVVKRVKGVVANAPSDYQIPVLQLERRIMDISDIVKSYLVTELKNNFYVNVRGCDISTIEIDKESEGWLELRKVTAEQQTKTIDAQTEINIQNLAETSRINAENMAETLRIQREESQRSQRLQTESNFIGAHALDQQTSVLKAAAENLGSMGNIDINGGGQGGGLNPAGMMTGMMLGGAMGQQMSGMMNNMGQQMQQSFNAPPPMPTVMYHVSLNGVQSGPFTIQQMQQMAQVGQITKQTYVWKQGMSAWDFAGNQPELVVLFAPPVPGSEPPPLPQK
ncbi:MAG: SPFH domain-containing protein [Bacteroidales bacterium]|nr:SPFH domain-containing protein [Bacteroidales bacterium]